MLETVYQGRLIAKIKRLLPDPIILKNDSGYLQGIPDLTVLCEDWWATLEVKRKQPKSENDFEPNQEWYIEQMNRMSFSACIYPENEQEVLYALQQSFISRRSSRLSKR